MAPIFRILGPLEVDGAGPLGGARPRALLRTLLLSANQVVTTDRLIDAVWGEVPPGTARHALQVYLSQLRKAIPDGAERIRTESAGYRIVVSEDEVDALAFERGVREAQSRLAAGDPGGASAAFGAALALWRGDMEAGEAEQAEAAHLEELKVAALEHRMAAELALGRHGQIVAELERLVAEHPLRERLRELLMLALYRSGRQADALALYTATRQMLVEELGLEPGRQLRELETAILRHDPSLNLAPVGRGGAARLPAPATPLIGRRREIEEIRTLLAGEARLVTLTGPGGTGKTRVGMQVALELAPSLRDGAVFVGLLLDNFEQVDAAAPLLSHLLAGAPELTLLVTSRRPLRLYGEHEFPLPPLRLDDEAVPLFLARARAAAARMESSGDVARVCEALDCLPLAIELAAARARSIPPADMLERLPSRLELASEGPRDAPERHRALQATIAWSHDLLDPRLQRVFESLSVFAGGCDADAAAVVAGAEAADLDALAQHSLIRAQEDRYALLETIREFALGRLEAGDGAGVVRDAHARHFLDLADEAQRQLRGGGDQLAWLARLDDEHDNLRAALAHLAQTDPPEELRMAGALVPFWAVRGHAAEALDRLDRALERDGPGDTREHAHALARASVMSWMRGDHARSATLAERALAVYRALDDNPGMVRALANLGYGALHAGDLDRARALYEECLEVARAGTSRRGVTVALNCLTELELGARDLVRARRVGEEGLALAREISDMKPALKTSLLAAAVALAVPAGAQASSISFAGNALVYSAAAGEANNVTFTLGTEAFEWGTRPAPCLDVAETSEVAIASFPAARCADDGYGTVECDVPASVTAHLNDRDDSMFDWEGPSTIDGGPGNEIVLEGRGGNDTINGGPGNDALFGGDGNDALGGGDGDDYLEGYGGLTPTEPLSTGGTDVYAGGPGKDYLDYAGRTEPLTLSLDGVANDGASDEADNVGADVEQVRGGEAADSLTGTPGANQLDGWAGDDQIRGGPGEDSLFGRGGNDSVAGDEGQDTIEGGDGDDRVDGGAGLDVIYGDEFQVCIPGDCASGRDVISARDGVDEAISCGPGEDTATLDPGDRVPASGDDMCEHVRAARRRARGRGVVPGAAAPARVRHRVRARLATSLHRTSAACGSAC